MATAHILIAEDEKLVASHIKHKLEDAGYQVPMIVSKGEEAVLQADSLHPDLVLMDIFLKGSMDGITAGSKIHDALDIPIIYLTAHEEDDIFQRAVLTDPYGYLLKPFKEKELKLCIEVALNKDKVEKTLKQCSKHFLDLLEKLDEAMTATEKTGFIRFNEAYRLTNFYPKAKTSPPPETYTPQSGSASNQDRPPIPTSFSQAHDIPKGLKPRLTPREVEILSLLAQGMVAKEIAGCMNLSTATARTYVQRILKKLKVHSKLEAVLEAFRQKIL